MKQRILAIILLGVLLAGGCSGLPGEERSFAVALGIGCSGGLWEISVRIPSYQEEGGYLTLSADGASFEGAMAALNASAPMTLHLGQLRLVIFTRELAESPDFGAVLSRLTADTTVRLQTSVCVTEEPLSAVMDALSPQTGSRLSKSVEALLETRQRLGVIPDATLGAIRRMGERQQPVLIRLVLEHNEESAPSGDKAIPGAGEAEDTKADAASSGEARPPVIQLDGGWLMGADGRVRGMLEASEQQVLSLMAGTLRQGYITLPEGTLELVDAKSSVSLRQGEAVCRVKVRLGVSALAEAAASSALARAMEAVAARLAEAGCDALGLGRRVIHTSRTMADWRELNWPARYPALPWRITAETQGEVRALP